MTSLHMPYEFDTRKAGRAVAFALVAGAAMLAALAAGLPQFDLVPARDAILLQAILAFIALSDLVAAVFLFRLLAGATGTIGRAEVKVFADKLMGLSSMAPHGTYSVSEFSEIELLRRRDRLRLNLLGKNSRLKLGLGVMPMDTARAHAAFLAEQLPNLKIVER